MTRVAIIAAMADELKPLVRGWERSARNGVDLWRWKFDGGEWVAACAGAGVAAATRAFGEVEKDAPVTLAISIGWAGALNDNVMTGQAYAVSGVIDARTGERFRSDKWSHECWLVTSATVADEAEKLRLMATYGGSLAVGLVDMEASAIARLATMRGIPFHCIKGVSDGVHDKLPDFNLFIAPRGQFQLSKFIVFAILRPWYWPSLMRMGENSKRAAAAIAESVLDFLDGNRSIRERNGYPGLER